MQKLFLAKKKIYGAYHSELPLKEYWKSIKIISWKLVGYGFRKDTFQVLYASSYAAIQVKFNNNVLRP